MPTLLELAAIRPEQVLKRLFRAINRKEDSTSDSGGGGGDTTVFVRWRTPSVRMRQIPTAAPTRSDSCGRTGVDSCRTGRPARLRCRATADAAAASAESPAARIRRRSTRWPGVLGQALKFSMTRGTTPVADFDACWTDGRALDHLAQWHPILHHERLAAVSGAFAVAWRTTDGALRLARDPIGERGLFYARTPAGLIFASTLHAILATGLHRAADRPHGRRPIPDLCVSAGRGDADRWNLQGPSG